MPRDYTARNEVSWIVPVAPVSHTAEKQPNMVNKTTKQNKKNVRSPPRPPNPSSKTHVYRRIRDALVSNAAIGGSAIDATTNGAGVYNTNLIFSALGIYGSRLETTGEAEPVGFSQVLYSAPHLPWLYHTAQNFQEYRILSATFIVKPILGSNTTGVVALLSDSDAMDVANNSLDLGTMSGGTAGPLKSNEIRHVCRVDSSWKKSSSNLFQTVDGTTAAVLLPFNTVNDMCFTSVFVNVTSAAVSSVVLRMFMEYDVEFRRPMSLLLNSE